MTVISNFKKLEIQVLTSINFETIENPWYSHVRFGTGLKKRKWLVQVVDKKELKFKEKPENLQFNSYTNFFMIKIIHHQWSLVVIRFMDPTYFNCFPYSLHLALSNKAAFANRKLKMWIISFKRYFGKEFVIYFFSFL